MRRTFVFLFLALNGAGGLVPSMSFALPTPLQVKPGRISAPMSSGVTIGGLAADEFSLLSVKTEVVQAGTGGEGIERLTFGYGDRFGLPAKGEPGFFHVALDRSAQRIVIDLAQMRKTAVDAPKLAQILAKSKYVASSDITMDPFDGSTNITLLTRLPVKMKVAAFAQKDDEQARIAIEISPGGHSP